MGIAYRCDTAKRLTVTVWDGPVTPEDWRALVAAQDADPDWPTPHLLGVFESAHGFRTFDEEVLAEMVDTYRGRAQGLSVSKAAVVAHQGLTAVTEIPRVLDEAQMRVITFADLRPACAWLEVDAAEVQRIVDELREQIRGTDEKRASSS